MNEENYTNPEFESQTPHPNPKKPFSTKLLIGIVVVVAIGIIVFATSCKHQWSKATCTEPQTCSLCGDTKGKPIGHKFSNATCTEPKTCQTCQITEGSAKGHTEGNWTITKSPTLISKGLEELLCSECEESLDSRTVQKKSPKVEDDHFNFTDKELIEWLNEETSATIGYTDLEVFDDDNPNTCYAVKWSDGETGMLILNHGKADEITDKNGNINTIMVYFESESKANALAAWIGEKISSKFDTDSAFEKLIYGRTYTAASMYIQRYELSTDFEVTWLSPYEYATSFFY